MVHRKDTFSLIAFNANVFNKLQFKGKHFPCVYSNISVGIQIYHGLTYCVCVPLS